MTTQLRNPAARGTLKGVFSVVAVVALLLITLIVQPSIGSPAATAIFLVGAGIVVGADWLTRGSRAS